MKKFIILPLISIFLLSGCSIIKNGSDLSGFIFRMNEKNEGYTLTENGFLYDEEKSEFYKFFIIDENEILLAFKADEKGRLQEMNIVTSCILGNSEFLSSFIKDALFCFINDNEILNTLFTETDFNNTILTVKNETIKAKKGNVELLLDVTEIGTVITVYKDT